jgi:hypothetical protein
MPATHNILLDTAGVYETWLRINLSTHEALFPTGVYDAEYDHGEFSPIRGPIPMYQQFTKTVLGDWNAMALQGHDYGPLAAHFCVPGDNVLLPITWISSSCKWPVTAPRRLHNGKSLCVFSPFIAPYLHCHGRPATEEEPAPAPTASREAKLGAKVRSGMGKVAQNVPGVGIVMLPTGGKTIWIRLRALDLLLAAGAVLWDAALDAVWGRVQNGKPSPSRHVSPFRKGDVITAAAVLRHARDKLVGDAAKDVAKNIINSVGSGQVAAPFKLAQFDFRTGKLTLWTWESGGWKAGDAPPVTAELAPPLRDPQRELLASLLEGAPHAG